MATHWAIDLGTSNTTICEDRSGRPHIVNLPDLAKIEPVTQTPVMPSCVCVMDSGAEQVLIGQEAVTYNWDGQATGFARGFKRHLGTESGRAMARVGGRTFTAQDVASLFLREVISTLEARFGEEVTDITIATPSGFYETYRAELQGIIRSLKHRGWWERVWARLRGKPIRIVFRTLDEPVAAALGYGVDVGRPTTLVAFDFGGGSMEAAVVRTHGARTVETGQAEVLAKQAVELGGDDVDRWILERFVPAALHDWPEWEVALRWEAERVKLLASAGSEGDFTFRNESFGKLDYNVLSDILAENGLYARMRELLGALLTELRTRHRVLLRRHRRCDPGGRVHPPSGSAQRRGRRARPGEGAGVAPLREPWREVRASLQGARMWRTSSTTTTRFASCPTTTTRPSTSCSSPVARPSRRSTTS